VSIPILSNISANSFTKEILTSLCAFSIALEASATLMLGALCVPAVIIFLYKSSISLAISFVDPDVTFLHLLMYLLYLRGLFFQENIPRKSLY
jgi:hypothetical protein